jgi:hypothetical protein
MGAQQEKRASRTNLRVGRELMPQCRFSARVASDERPVRAAHDFDDSQLRPVAVPTRDNAPTADLTCGVVEAVGGHAYGVRDRTGLPTLKGTCECASPPVRHRGQSR